MRGSYLRVLFTHTNYTHDTRHTASTRQTQTELRETSHTRTLHTYDRTTHVRRDTKRRWSLWRESETRDGETARETDTAPRCKYLLTYPGVCVEIYLFRRTLQKYNTSRDSARCVL